MLLHSEAFQAVLWGTVLRDQGVAPLGQGTHDRLLQRHGFYASLIKVQVENGEIEVA